MEKLILTDVDGVLLNWTTQFHEYMSNKGHQKRSGALTYRQEANFPQLNGSEVREIINYFNTSAWLMGLPPYRDARSGVARLLEHGYKFHAITAMGNDDNWALRARKINLAQLFGHDVFVEITATDMYDPNAKRAALSEYKNSGLYWIEDSPPNAELGAELGLKPLLMLNDHNTDYEPKGNIERVSSWVQICDIILDTD